jgi:hypothetical protein
LRQDPVAGKVYGYFCENHTYRNNFGKTAMASRQWDEVMMGRKWIGFAMLLALLGINGYAPAIAAMGGQSFMRCKGHVLNVGDSKHEVRTKCGKPNSIAIEDKEAEIETWVYDFGPGRFVHFLTFSGDSLERIESKGRF